MGDPKEWAKEAARLDEQHRSTLTRLWAGNITHAEAITMVEMSEVFQSLLEAKHRKQTAADFAAWIVDSIDEGWGETHRYIKGGAMLDALFSDLLVASPITPTSYSSSRVQSGAIYGAAATW